MVILIHEQQKCSTMAFLLLSYGDKKDSLCETVLNK